MSNAGSLFVCVCCNEDCEMESAMMDKDLRGPVCPHCSVLLKWAGAYLESKRTVFTPAGNPETKFLNGIEGCTQNQNSRIK